MLRSTRWIRSRGSRVAAAAALAVFAWLVAVPMAATPVNVWFDRQAGQGIEAASVSAASGAGLASYAPSIFFADPTNAKFSFVNPPAIPFNPRNPSLPPSRTNATRGTSTWQITALDQSYQDLWIVFRSHSLADPNFSFYDPGASNPAAPGTVGLNVDGANGWALLQGSSATYLGYFIGDLALGGTANIPILYRVAQDLFEESPGVFRFPRLSVGYTSFAVPEPSIAILLGVGLIGLVAGRRRS